MPAAATINIATQTTAGIAGCCVEAERRIVIYKADMYGFETWSVTLWKEKTEGV